MRVHSAASVSRRLLLRQLSGSLLAAGLLATAGSARAVAQVFAPYWVRTYGFTELWSGPDRGAISFGTAPPESYFKVVAPQVGSRLYVWSPYSRNYTYIEASAAGPVGEPPAEAIARPPVIWVANHLPTTLWSGPGPKGVPLGQLDRWSPFEVLGMPGPRLLVRDPRTDGQAYLDASAVGRVGPPDTPLPSPARWWGMLGSAANARAAATTEAGIRAELGPRTPVVVERWVAGQEVLPDQPTWAQLGDEVFVYSPLLRPSPIARPPEPPAGWTGEGRWIDANLTHQVAVAYEGETAVYLARFSSGRPGWETSTGVFRIFRRVAREVMDSSTLLGRDAARASYRVEDIKWTQYFTADGQAIHHNYWRDPALFGIPSSHGCLGMLEPDARWFWDWAEIGTPLVVHY